MSAHTKLSRKHTIARRERKRSSTASAKPAEGRG